MPEKDFIDRKEASGTMAGDCAAEIKTGNMKPHAPGPYQWEDLAVPEELQDKKIHAFYAFPLREIEIIKSERIKVRKVIRKKGLIPGRFKEEIVETWGQREIPERVPVDPEVISDGWAETGILLGTREKTVTLLRGRSIYGKSGSSAIRDISVGDIALEDMKSGDGIGGGSSSEGEISTGGVDEFYLGSGILEAGDELKAEYVGFVRRGKNWIEVVPFQPLCWELSLSRDKATCLLDFNPGDHHSEVPKAEEILENAVGLGFSEKDLIPPAQITRAVNESIKNGVPLKGFSLTTSQDGFFEVFTSEDKLKGLLTIRKGSGGGKPLILKEVGAAVKKSGFTGMDFEKIKTDLLDFYDGPNRELKEYLLAAGKEPGKGEDRVFDFTCEMLAPKQAAAHREHMARLTPVDLEEIPKGKAFPPEKAARYARIKTDVVIAALGSGALGEAGKDVYGKVLEGEPGKEPSIELLGGLKREKDSIISLTTGMLDIYDNNDKIVIRGRPHENAVMEIDISDDEMKAFITVEEGSGSGILLSRERIEDAVKAAGVVKGIDPALLEEAFRKAKEGAPVRNFPFAEGLSPVDPGKSKLVFLVETAEGKGVTIKKDGRADFKNQDRITPVTEGQPVARVLSPDIQPQEGWTVKGKTIPVSDIPVLDLNIGEGIRQESDDKGNITLVAERSGELIYENNQIGVTKVHTVSADVDYSSGNIKFSGAVNVVGGVLPGFAVIAEGGIQIGGTVERALISSGDTVRIAQGVVGGGMGIVRAKKDIETVFAEQATLLAVGDVKIKNTCLKCMIRCNGVLAFFGDKGALVGGSVKARLGVKARTIGNQKGVKTEISFGQDYLVADQIEHEEKEIYKINEQVKKIDDLMLRLEREGNIQELDKCRHEKLYYLKIVKKRSLRLFTLREKFEEHNESEIIVKGTLYPGVIFESHGRTLEITREASKVRIFFNQKAGKIDLEAAAAKETGGKKEAGNIIFSESSGKPGNQENPETFQGGR